MSSAEVLANAPLLDADELQRDITDLITNRPAPLRAVPDLPLPKALMPDYVTHQEGVNQVGRLSAEAVVREFDAAVKEIEALGVELLDAAKKCEEMVAGVHAMVAEIKELASNYREEGKRHFLKIEECSMLTSEVRVMCEALKNKIAASQVTAAT